MLHKEENVSKMTVIEKIDALADECDRVKDMISECYIYQARIDKEINQLVLDNYILEPWEREYYLDLIKEDNKVIDTCTDFEIQKFHEHINKDWLLDNL